MTFEQMDSLMAGTPSTALVTGAASGIGAAVARLLAARGTAVTCVDIDSAGLAETVQTITRAGGVATAETLDLADASAVSDFVGMGRAPLDQLALCAGIYRPTPADDFDLTTYRAVIDANVTGALQLATALVPRLERSSVARVVTISSIHALHGEAGSLAYGASKAALAAATRVLAVELAGRGILVNSIAPGFIDTPMAMLPDGTKEFDSDEFAAVYLDAGKLPLGRPGTADEVAEVAGFLLSPLNSYITGHILVVDGGLTATF